MAKAWLRRGEGLGKADENPPPKPFKAPLPEELAKDGKYPVKKKGLYLDRPEIGIGRRTCLLGRVLGPVSYSSNKVVAYIVMAPSATPQIYLWPIQLWPRRLRLKLYWP